MSIYHVYRYARLRFVEVGFAAMEPVTMTGRSAGTVAVGKQLPLLAELVERAAAGWRVVDRGGCWDRFMVDYPGPRALSTFWAIR